MAARAGADWIGLVSAMPSGPGVISDERIAEIAEAVSSEVATVLLTSRRHADEICEQHQRTHTNALQLVDQVPPEELRKLRHAIPEIRLLQVIHVGPGDSLLQAKLISPLVDGLLLDSGNPGSTPKQLGGTGRLHDWSISRRIREESEKPVFLAGGLHAGNLHAAVLEVGPYAVDVCSGVRTDGALDGVKLDAFMRAVRTDY
jgi:phosphoribosylanthranilate isomerase